MENKNAMICDLETGVCGAEGEDAVTEIDLNPPKKTIDLYYVTDPICSHCWALEPVLRRFTEQYGDYFHFHTVMGGLLEKWSDDPVDPGNGISKPSDVAGHWREVGEHSRMPIDGSVWLDNPLHSSFPPSRVYKVIQKRHSDKKAAQFLRRAREALFVFNENIAQTPVMVRIVNELGLDGETIVAEAEEQTGHQLLAEDFQLAARLGVRGFPTIVMINEQKKGVKVVGARALQHYVDALKHVLGEEELQPKQQPPLSELLQKEKLLFAKEIEVMYDVEPQDLQRFIAEQLGHSGFEVKEILGEKYIAAG